MSEPLLRIGTRGSALALVQTAQVAAALAASDPALAAPGAIATVPIRTTGDRVQDRPLAEIGGKALFTREIEEALLDHRIDIAVHSTKDLPTFLPQGLTIGGYLEREDPRDAFLSRRADSLAALPRGAVLGSSSPRRTAQLLHERPDLTIAPLRGNIDTRVAKLDGGDDRALGLDRCTRLVVVGRRDEMLFTRAHLQRERSLTGLRQQLRRIEAMEDLV